MIDDDAVVVVLVVVVVGMMIMILNCDHRCKDPTDHEYEDDIEYS